MIIFCPYCGHRLPQPLSNGISSCDNCRRAFDSSRFNKLLNFSWIVRRLHVYDADILVHRYNCDQEDANLIIKYIADECLTHEEFVSTLRILLKQVA